MSDPRFIFETVDFQNGANTINNFVKTYNANCNAAATGNSFQFKSDYDRMKNLIGSSGQTRNSGYYDGLYATYYALTADLPSSNGPGSSGWNRVLGRQPLDRILLTNTNLQQLLGQGTRVGALIGGYLYSPSNTTTKFETVSDDGILVYLNGTKVIDNWASQPATTRTSAVLDVFAGYNPITLLWCNGGGPGQLDFNYQLPNGAAYTGLLKCNFFYNYNQM